MVESGPWNPYPNKLSVIEAGAYTDILLVNDHPLEDITVVGGTTQWFDADQVCKPIENTELITKDNVI